MKDWASVEEVLVAESDELSADVAASAAHDVLLVLEDEEGATEADTELDRAENTADAGKVKAAAAAGRARMGQARNFIVPWVRLVEKRSPRDTCIMVWPSSMARLR